MKKAIIAVVLATVATPASALTEGQCQKLRAFMTSQAEEVKRARDLVVFIKLKQIEVAIETQNLEPTTAAERALASISEKADDMTGSEKSVVSDGLHVFMNVCPL